MQNRSLDNPLETERRLCINICLLRQDRHVFIHEVGERRIQARSIPTTGLNRTYSRRVFQQCHQQVLNRDELMAGLASMLNRLV